MDFFKISKKMLHKYMSHSATIYIQSTPHFLMEAFILLVALMLTIFQHIHVISYSKKILRLKPHTIYCKADGEMVTDRKQLITTIAYKRPSLPSTKSQLGWILSGHPETVATDEDRKRLTDEVLSLTPEQFVKIEKEKKLREKEFDSCQYSLSTLCQIAIKRQWSNSTFKEKLATLKENFDCNTSSLEGKYLGHKTGLMTESLLCMLESLITNSSMENPLPFKGNITTFALDAGELVKIDQKLEDSQTSILEKKSISHDPVVLKSVNWADVVPQSEDLD